MRCALEFCLGIRSFWFGGFCGVGGFWFLFGV